MIDLDGSIAYSGIQKLSFTPNEPRINVYPNPLGQERMLFVEMQIPDEDFVNLEIYTLGGQLVHKESALGNRSGTLVRIPAEDFGAGVYFIRFRSQKWDAVRRFMVE